MYYILGAYYSDNRGIREEAKIAINAARLMVLTIIETVFLPLFNNTPPASTTLATYTGTADPNTTDTNTNINTNTITTNNNNTSTTTTNNTAASNTTTSNNTATNNNNNNKLMSSLRYLALRLFNMNTLPEYRRDAMIGSELYG